MKRTYWIGWSDTGETKPEDHNCYHVANEEELADAVERIIDDVHEDWYAMDLEEDE